MAFPGSLSDSSGAVLDISCPALCLRDPLFPELHAPAIVGLALSPSASPPLLPALLSPSRCRPSPPPGRDQKTARTTKTQLGRRPPGSPENMFPRDRSFPSSRLDPASGQASPRDAPGQGLGTRSTSPAEAALTPAGSPGPRVHAVGDAVASSTGTRSSPTLRSSTYGLSPREGGGGGSPTAALEPGPESGGSGSAAAGWVNPNALFMDLSETAAARRSRMRRSSSEHSLASLSPSGAKSLLRSQRRQRLRSLLEGIASD